ncbi:MAG: TolC family protein [Desulfovibrionaceae bacterium]
MNYNLMVYLFGVLLLTPLTAQAATKAKDTLPPAQSVGKTVTVVDTINATLRNHRAIKVIQENRAAVQSEVRRAQAGWGPRVDITARGGARQLSDSTTRSYQDDAALYGASNVGATLVQPLWDGFATRSRVRTAEATLDSMTERVFDNATTLGLDSIIAHVDLLRRRKILELAVANVKRHQEILASSRDRESLGADTMADVTQTEGRLARALSTLADAKAALLQGEASYRRLTGTPVPSAIESVVLPMPMYESPGTVLETAEAKNPKIVAYKADIRAATGNKELAESNFHPMLNLEAGPSYSNRGGHDDQWTSGVDIMGVVRWNVFNSGADVANTKAMSAKVRQSRQVLYNFMDELVLQVQNTWTGYQSAQEQHKHYTNAIKYNTQTRDAYLEQFYTGQRSLRDVLDAESELFNTSVQAATAAGNILVGGYSLYALAGVLLPTLNIETKGLYETPSPVVASKPVMDFSK